MAWVEKRETTYEEDKVYSLFGIFDVHIPVLYCNAMASTFWIDRRRTRRISSRTLPI
jgi:hypothetical protein